ncbi:MAG: hypothetical protein U9P49_05845 [Thermodesulfobacteriota bacterium]|nr:hypothetical protein [Thermodesulfobacteriota bacterium]
MKQYEIKPLVGLAGLLAFAFAMFSIQSDDSILKLYGAVSFLIFMLLMVYLFSMINSRRVILLYVLLIVVSVLDSYMMCIIFAVVLLIYIIGLAFKYVMGCGTEGK